MRFLTFALFFSISLYSFSQEPDTTRRGKSKRISLTKFPKKETPPEKKAFVVISSEAQPAEQGNWEHEWTNYIEEQSREIAHNVLIKTGDSLKITYKVLLDFSVLENGSVQGLTVSCSPDHTYIKSECVRLAHNAPKRKSTIYPGKYVKMRVTQPIDIKVNHN
jgi:hypothetical protein